MILRSIRLEDFGLFAGITELDLIPRVKKGVSAPVVLIGGKNGAGKTTLLEAVRLALYGRRALGPRVGLTEYETYLRDRINRSSLKPEAAVTLEFDYAEAGAVHRYRVRREWAVRGKSIIENLLLDKDGEAISSVPREEWHQFLQELIPPGVSQLFFFDGEKIQQIAGDEDNEQLAEAVRSLLGIELVGRLRTDLGLFLARHQRRENAEIGSRLEAIMRELAKSADVIQKLSDDVAELASIRDSQARAAEQIRRRFVSEGGDAALNRNRVESDREEARRAANRGEHELRELANHLLPFAMAPKLVGQFRNALFAASAGGGERASVAALRSAMDDWKSQGEPKREARWSKEHWTDLRRFLQAQAKAASRSGTTPVFAALGDGTAALARLTEVDAVVRPRAQALLKELERLSKRGRELDKRLERADSAASGVMLDELRAAERLLGSTESTLKARQDELALLRGQRVTMERDRARLLSEQADAAAASNRAELAARTAQVLADYEQRLLTHKLTQLRTEFVRCFDHLARKPGLVTDVSIDPTTFATRLFDSSGTEIAKSALSAGEKQVYAIAMLWSLARTSGRPLPMIIDTPLARLDSDHRGNLIERYFAAASHQVIMLSTDTEVDAHLVEKLRPSISHSYLLDYDPTTGGTGVSHGYFETGRITETKRAIQQA